MATHHAQDFDKLGSKLHHCWQSLQQTEWRMVNFWLQLVDRVNVVNWGVVNDTDVVNLITVATHAQDFDKLGSKLCHCWQSLQQTEWSIVNFWLQLVDRVKVVNWGVVNDTDVINLKTMATHAQDFDKLGSKLHHCWQSLQQTEWRMVNFWLQLVDRV